MIVAPIVLMLVGLSDLYDEWSLKNEIIEIETAKIPQLQSENESIEKAIKKINEVKDNVKDFRSKVEKSKQDLEKVGRLIPPIGNRTAILDELSRVARELNIKNISFKPKYEKNNHGGLYITNGIEFEGRGTYLQFLVFFEKMKKPDRIFNVSSVEVTSSSIINKSKHVIVDFKTIIETFHYNKDYKTKAKKGGKS